MIYTGLGRVGEIADVKANGGADVAEVYGGIMDSNPIYYKQRDMVGTSPMQFKALGLPLKDYHIYGETMQDGSPSPDMPVDVVGCGVRTENLAPNTGWVNGYIDTEGKLVSANVYRLEKSSDFIPLRSGIMLAYSYRDGSFPSKGVQVAQMAWRAIGFYRSDKSFIFRAGGGEPETLFASVPKDTAYIRLTLRTYGQDVSNVMLNLGSTALPYEPYGYKIPVTIGNTTTPIFIGAEPLHRIGEYADYVDYSSGKIVRKIKKLVLTGEENIELNNSWLMFYRKTTEAVSYESVACTHYISVKSFAEVFKTTNSIAIINVGIYINSGSVDVTGFKSYLAAQYAAGIPVTVWYVLTEPIEEDPPVPFPELLTLFSTNTMSIDTTVKPSQMYVKGNIKPTGYGQLLDVNDVDIRDSNSTPIFIRG